MKTIFFPHHRYRFISLFVLFTSFCLSLKSQTPKDFSSPKNVILMIGDGMGYNCIKAADYYFGPSSLREFPVNFAVSTTYAGLGYDTALAWKDPAYLSRDHTESSAAATALATGYKTTLNSVGLSPEGDTVMNLTEFAKKIGKSAGVITSVPISHATPAGFAVHNRSRSNYIRLAYDIFFRSRLDVVMGCGNPEFDDNGALLGEDWNYAGYVGDSATWLWLKANTGAVTQVTAEGEHRTVQDVNGDGTPDAWTLLSSRADFTKLSSGPTPLRVLGCPEVYSTLQQSRKMANGESNDTPPFITGFNSKVPSLSEMTMGGLNVLDNNPSGFFLMVEGGAIDWANHENQKGRMLEEMKSFRDAVDSVVAWVESHSSWEETLLIVTADHECGNLWGGEPFVPVADNGTGILPGIQYNSHDHTNSLVGVFARGEAASLLSRYADETDPVKGPYIQNIEIPLLIFGLWGRK